jgi:ubiquinone/menaquinone biosynthesis C-methylase UbiE
MPQTKTDLSIKLHVVEKVIDIPKVLARNADDTSNIAKYYKKNRLAYRLFNSHEGFVHMGISNDGSFDKADFYKQAKLVLEQINELNAKNVLELAPGKAATLKYLAKEKPSVRFYGLDLPNGQLNTKTSISNIELSYGDYHDLGQYSNDSMDIVYIIEALCHAHDKNKVITEAFRVLRKGGRLIVIDGYFSKGSSKLSDDQKTVMKLVANSMMVTDKQQDYKTFYGFLENNGLMIIESIDYSKNIMPSLHRLEHTASRFIKRPRLAKVITSVAGELVTANAAAGYLMPTCVEDGLFEYRYTVAKK